MLAKVPFLEGSFHISSQGMAAGHWKIRLSGLVDKYNSDWDVKQRGLVMVRTTGIAIYMFPLDETFPAKGLNNTTKVLWKNTTPT